VSDLPLDMTLVDYMSSSKEMNRKKTPKAKGWNFFEPNSSDDEDEEIE